MIISRTPFRMSFFGGGTDYPPWFREHGGAVLATTINKYAYISLRTLPPFFAHKYRLVYSKVETTNTLDEIEHPAVRAVLQWGDVQEGMEIHYDGDLPARSGLGSSSSFTVGLIKALKAHRGQLVSKEALAQKAIYLEQEVLQEPVGSQDQISAAYGGFNKISFHPDGSFDVNPIVLRRDKLEWLESHLMLFFTGISRYSSQVAKKKIANIDKKAAVLKEMHAMVDEAIDILNSDSRPIHDFGKLLHEAWMKKRSLSEAVSTDFIDELYNTARGAGAIGGKIMGAGGGGFMMFFVEPPNQKYVQAALGDLIHVPFRFETSGSRVVLYQPNGLGC